MPNLRKTENLREVYGKEGRAELDRLAHVSSNGGREKDEELLKHNEEQTVTLEAVLNPRNRIEAVDKVVENKGSAGVDGMEVWQLADPKQVSLRAITEVVRSGAYKPQAVLRVLIPKEEKGKFRPLGIPTVTDRFVQQMVAQVLSRAYEPYFSDSSHGFRPGRSCQTAINQCLEYANDGYRWVVDLDLAKFFDTVNHSKLLQVLSERVKDGRVISLINKFLRAPVRDGKTEKVNEMGTPQGGVISPVLANILLNELDQVLEARGHKFVRYADDMMILCRSRKAAERTLRSVRVFIEKKLFLRINEEKTKICKITDASLKFLGFGFYAARNPDGGDSIVKSRPHKKSQAKFKKALKEVTSRNLGLSYDRYREKLAQLVVGWVNYYRYSSMKGFLLKISEWLRRRIRQIYWKRWKKTRTKYSALRKLGVGKEQAWQWANTRQSYWHIANSWILATTLTNRVLEKLEWKTPDKVYERLLKGNG